MSLSMSTSIEERLDHKGVACIGYPVRSDSGDPLMVVSSKRFFCECAIRAVFMKLESLKGDSQTA